MRASTKARGTCWVEKTQSSFIPSARKIKCPCLSNRGLKWEIYTCEILRAGAVNSTNNAVHCARYIARYIVPGEWGVGQVRVQTERRELEDYRNVTNIAVRYIIIE